MKKYKGFSLIELIVVMAVMAILVLIASPIYLHYTKDAKVKQIEADIKTASNVVSTYMLRNNDALPVGGTSVSIDTINTYLAAGKVYGPAGVLASIDASTSYETIPSTYVKKDVGSKLDGQFISSEGGDVYYIDAEPEGFASVSVPLINLTTSDNPDEMTAAITYSANSITKEYKINDGAWTTVNSETGKIDGIPFFKQVYAKVNNFVYQVNIPYGSVIYAREFYANDVKTEAESSLTNPDMSANINRSTYLTAVTIGYPENAVVKEYRIGTGEWTSYTGPINITNDSNIASRGIDSKGNVIAYSYRHETLPVLVSKTGGSGSDAIQKIIVTPDGGFVAVGSSTSNDEDFLGLNKGGTDGFIAKYDSTGKKEWLSTVGGSGSDILYSIQCTSDGGYVAAGESFSSDVNMLNRHYGSTGNKDGIIVKFSSDGTLVWVRNIGGSSDDTLTSVIKSTDGNFIAVGSSFSKDNDLSTTAGRWWDPIMVKFTSSGTISWVKTDGGGLSDYFRYATPLINGNYVSAGYFEGGGLDTGIAKFNGNGTVLWEYKSGGSASDNALSATATPDGGFIVSGMFYSNDGAFLNLNKGDADAFIAKYSTDGTLKWMKTFGGSGGEAFLDAVVDSNGDYVVVGYSNSINGDMTNINKGKVDAVIAKYQSDGTLVWLKTIGGSEGDTFVSIAMMPNGNYLVSGSSGSTNGDMTNSNMDTADALIVIIDSDGNIVQ